MVGKEEREPRVSGASSTTLAKGVRRGAEEYVGSDASRSEVTTLCSDEAPDCRRLTFPLLAGRHLLLAKNLVVMYNPLAAACLRGSASALERGKRPREPRACRVDARRRRCTQNPPRGRSCDALGRAHGRRRGGSVCGQAAAVLVLDGGSFKNFFYTMHQHFD